MFNELKKMLGGLSWKKLKLWPKWAMFYCLGIITAFIIGAISAAIDPPIIGDQKEMVKRWDMKESPRNQLLIKFDDVNGDPWKVILQREEKSDLVENIILVKQNNNDEEHYVFRYFGSGSRLSGLVNLNGYDNPMVAYGWLIPEDDESGCLWIDVNFDSQFDGRRIPSKYEIPVGENWEQGEKVTGSENQVRTKSGIYKFDMNLGRWLKASDKK